MILHRYQLAETIYRTNQDRILWKSEKGLVEIQKDALAIPIVIEGQETGYIFHGQGMLLLDTIVETEEGAIGTPVHKELTRPFLMLADMEQIKQQLTEANQEDLTKLGYEDQRTFGEEAEDLFNRFFKKGRRYHHSGLDKNRGFIFAFPNPDGELDRLIAKGSKLVYTSKDKTFISNREKVVLKSADEVVCASNGRSVIVNKGRSLIIKK